MLNLLSQSRLIFSFLAIFVLFTGATLAQDSDADIVVIPDVAETVVYVPGSDGLSNVLNSLLNTLYDYFYIPATAGFVVMGTGFLRRLIPVTKIKNTEFIVFGIMAVVFIFYTVAGRLEQTETLQMVVDVVTQIGNVLLLATGTGIVTSKLHKSANKNGVAIAGFKHSQSANG